MNLLAVAAAIALVLVPLAALVVLVSTLILEVRYDRCRPVRLPLRVSFHQIATATESERLEPSWAAVCGGLLVAGAWRLDLLVFTGGVGKHQAPVREAAAHCLPQVDVDLDAARNGVADADAVISAEGAAVQFRGDGWRGPGDRSRCGVPGRGRAQSMI